MTGTTRIKSNIINPDQTPLDQYFKIFDQLPDIVYIIDPNGRFTYLNPAIRILGYESTDLIGRHFWRIIHPADRKRISREFILPALKGKVTGDSNAPKLFDERRTGARQTRNLEIRLISKIDFGKIHPPLGRIGSIIAWGNISAAGRYEERRKTSLKIFQGTIGVIRDITERKTAEDKLRDQEKRFHSLIDSINDGFIQVDNQDRVLYVNDNLCRMTGYAREELVGKIAYRLLFDPLEQAVIKVKNALRHRKIADKYEIRLKKKNGEHVWIQISGSPVLNDQGRAIGSIGIFSDISEQKRAEIQLHFQADMLSHVSDAIITTDLTFKIQTWNRAAEKLFGFQAYEVIGKPLEKVTRMRYSKEIKGISVNKILKTDRWNGEVTLRRKDGSFVYVLISFTVIREPKAGYSSIVVIIRDITERNRAEEQIERLSRFPSENTNPVLRFSAQGIMEYANAASDALLPALGAEIGGTVNAEWKKRIRETLAKKHSVDIELRVKDRTFSVSIVPVVDYGYVNLYAKDISDRKRVEVILRESEEKYRLVVENAREAIVVAQDGRLKFVNNRTVEMIKYSKRVLLARSFTDFIHPEDRAMVADRYRRRIAGQVVPDKYVFRVVDRDGKFLWVEIRSALIKWEGRPATLNFLTDITERKKYEHALTRRLEVEKTLAKTSEMIVKTSDINIAIACILAYLGKTLDADWLGIFQLDEDRTILDNTHEWRKPGTKSLKAEFQGITEKNHPWDFGKLKSGKILNILAADLPPASGSRKLYRKHGIKAILIIPIFYETRFFGTIDVFSKIPERIWDDEDVRLLKTTGDIISASIVKHHIQVRLNQTHDELKIERNRMIELTRLTIDTQEKERFYLASEIHDSLLQELAGMLYFVKNIDARNDDPNLPGKREILIENIKSVINRGRVLISHIEPLEDPNITLIQGIRKSFDLRFSGTGVALYFNHPSRFLNINFFLKTNILRIVQEALMNIYKHARATAVSITLTLYRNLIVIKIKDNGAGFSTSLIDQGKKVHYGLLSVKERAKLVGGTLSIVSKPGSGTIITAEIPLK